MNGLLCLLVCVTAQPVVTDTAENLRLTQYRQQHRRTESGELCAAAFVQNKQRFTDCTTTLAPDGTTTGTEWCYVEAQYNYGAANATTPTWGFCRPVVDYDYIRTAATQSLKTRIDEVTRLSAKLAADKAKIDDVVERYERVCTRELKESEAKVNEMEKLLQHGVHALNGAMEAANSIAALDASLEEMTAAAEAEFVQALSQPENCRAVRGYEDDSQPDGLLGVYYPTPTFTCTGGQKQVRIDPVINFAWTGRSPAPGIPHESFSVRWDGYLQAPESGEYRLHLETACGARLFLNRKLVLLDRMPDTPYEVNPGLTDTVIPLLPPSGVSGLQKTTSNPILLTGGHKIPLRLEMLHSAHLLWQDEDTSVVKLSWSSARMAEQVISSDFLFSSNPTPVLKISRLPAALTDIQYLSVGLQPFLNDPRSYIGDLPPELDNAKVIRMAKQYQSSLQQSQGSAPGGDAAASGSTGMLEFAVNVPSQLFVAYLHNNPLEPCLGRGVTFKRYNSNAVLGVYVYAGGGPPAGGVKSRRASYVDYYKIDVAVLSAAGGYRFTVKDAPFVVFLKALPASSNGCDGGEVVCLSDPSDPKSAFESCTASSVVSDAYACEYGLNRLHRDERYTTWKTGAGRGMGEYLEITFRETVRPTSFTFKPLDDPLTWPSEITVYFEPGGSHSVEPQKFDLIYSSDIQLLKYTLIPTSTRYLRFEVSGMYATGQSTGGSVEVMGTVCNQLETVAPDPSAAGQEVTSYAIDDCATVISELPAIPALRSGLIIDVDCPATCEAIDETATTKVFGTSVYSVDSAVCLAAVHAGICSAAGAVDVCRLTLLLINGSAKYMGTLRNGILSGLHGPSDLSFVVQPRSEGASYDNTKSAKGVNTQVSRLFVFTADDASIVKIADGTLGYDDGSVYAPHTEFKLPEYGWLRQAAPTDCDAAAPTNATTAAIKGGVQFPPGNQGSLLCDGTQDCSENYWSVKLNPNSRYDVVAQVGHPCKPEGDAQYRYDLSANNVRVVSNKMLSAGQSFYGTARSVKSDENGLIKFTSSCTGTCDQSLTTLLQLKIQESKVVS